MNSWPVYYYKRVKYYSLAFIPLALGILAPSLFTDIIKNSAGKYKWVIENATWLGFAILIAAFIITKIITLKK